MSRRPLLVLASVLVCSTGFLGESRAKSGPSTEVEVAGYSGQASGAWICGSQASVRYGGLAATVRHSERRATPEQGIGTTVVAGAAVEGERILVADDAGRAVEGVLGAGHLRVGYHYQYFGLEGGIAMLSGLNVQGRANFGFVPIGELSLGRRDVGYFLAGIGPSQLTNQFAFGAPYLGFGLPIGGASLQLRGSADLAMELNRTPPRFDLFWTVPMSALWSLRAGLSMGGGELAPASEASLGLSFRK